MNGHIPAPHPSSLRPICFAIMSFGVKETGAVIVKDMLERLFYSDLVAALSPFRRALVRSRALALVFASLLGACGTTGPLESRHEPSGISMRLWTDGNGQDRPFADYTATTTAAIAKHHWMLSAGREAAGHEASGESTAGLLSPHQWSVAGQCSPERTTGVLLVHGLSDSPFLMRDLGDAIARDSRCVLVRSMLLSGHASRPGDLLHVTKEDWIDAVRYGIDSFAGAAGKVHLLGFSTGAAVSLHWAVNPDRHRLAVPIASLTMIAPAIEIVGLPRFPTVTMRLAHLLSLAGIGSWRDLHEDIDFAKYESFPLNAGYQLFRLDEAIRGYDLSGLEVPVLVVMSEDDKTVDAQAAIALFRRIPTPSSAMLLVTHACRAESAESALSSRCDHGLLDASNDPRIAFVPGVFEKEKVQSFAHISFPSRPDNAHYGLHGDYANCFAYLGANGHDGRELPDKYCACITPAMLLALESRGRSCAASPALALGEIRYGENLDDDLKRYVLRRLSFNPYFDVMVRRIRHFVGIDAPDRASGM